MDVEHVAAKKIKKLAPGKGKAVPPPANPATPAAEPASPRSPATPNARDAWTAAGASPALADTTETRKKLLARVWQECRMPTTRLCIERGARKS